MDYRLRYTQKALNDLDEIIGNIAEDDAQAASRFGNSLLDHIDLLGRLPRMGWVTRKRPRVRKLVHSPILVYYRVHEDKHVVEVLHLRHGARKPPESELGSKGRWYSRRSSANTRSCRIPSLCSNHPTRWGDLSRPVHASNSNGLNDETANSRKSRSFRVATCSP